MVHFKQQVGLTVVAEAELWPKNQPQPGSHGNYKTRAENCPFKYVQHIISRTPLKFEGMWTPLQSTCGPYIPYRCREPLRYPLVSVQQVGFPYVHSPACRHVIHIHWHLLTSILMSCCHRAGMFTTPQRCIPQPLCRLDSRQCLIIYQLFTHISRSVNSPPQRLVMIQRPNGNEQRAGRRARFQEQARLHKHTHTAALF